MDYWVDQRLFLNRIKGGSPQHLAEAKPMTRRGGHMSLQETNKALVRRFYAEIDAGNLDAMDHLVAEEYVDHNPPPFPGLEQGRAGLKQALQIFWEATPGRHEVEDQVAEGDKVVTRLTAYGKHTGNLPGGLVATGREIQQSAVAVHRVHDGQLAEHWSGRDDLGLMVQLGVIHLPG
ncbi:ester cyclase [Amycolatopsis sp. NPDC051128]|uniref:ester cyclase n=1 Tax=Amycolatopsis sp. NPDC051128 TaxID=3155412 RepID=UPI003412393F